MAPEYGATVGFFPVDAGDAALPAADRRGRADRSTWSSATARSSSSSAPHELPIRRTTKSSIWRWTRSSPVWPARSGRRTACRCRQLQTSFQRTLTAPVPGRRICRAARRSTGARPVGTQRLGGRDRPRRGRHRRHHLLHQHLQSLRDDRRRSAGPQRAAPRPARPAVRQDQPGAGLARGHRLPASGRACSNRWPSSASTSSATAARPASATAARWPGEVVRAIGEGDLVAAAVLSGNRNFEGRINPHVRASYLTSPPAGGRPGPGRDDGCRSDPRPARHRRGWSARSSCATCGRRRRRSRSSSSNTSARSSSASATPRSSAATRRGLRCRSRAGDLYAWDPASTYIQEPPFFEGLTRDVPPLQDVTRARVLALLGDSVTTDAISPAGAIPADGPAGRYLIEQGVPVARLQLLRQPARQRPRHDPWDVRQHPPQEPAGPGRRGRR